MLVRRPVVLLALASTLSGCRTPDTGDSYGFPETPPCALQEAAPEASPAVFGIPSIPDPPGSSVIFTGGGAKALKTGLLRPYPTARISEDPVMDNALGLARLARAKYGGVVVGFDPGFGGFKAVLLS